MRLCGIKEEELSLGNRIMRQLLTLFLIVSSLNSKALAALRPYLSLHPVALEQDSKGNSLISFWLPCGSNFEGLYISQKHTHIKVGAVAAVLSGECLSLPKKYQVRFDKYFKKKTSFKSIIPAREPMRLRELPVENIFHTNQSITATYNSRCSVAIGFIFKPVTPDSGRIRILGKKRQGACKQIVARSIKQKNKLASEYKTITSTKQAPHYKLYLAPIKRSTIRTFSSNISLKYLAKCNEVGLGPVKTRHGYSILVASFPENLCHIFSKAGRWTVYRGKNLFDINRRSLLLQNSMSHKLELNISSPTSMTVRKRGLFFADNANCHGTVGVFLAQINQHIKIASLHPARYTRCNGPDSPSTFLLKTSLNKTHEVLPLRLKY